MATTIGDGHWHVDAAVNPVSPLREPLVAVLDQVSDAVLVHDARGNVAALNRAATVLLALEDGEALLGRPASGAFAGFEVLDEAGGPLPARQLATLLAADDDQPRERSVRIRTQAGEERRVLVRTAAIPRADGLARLAVTTLRALADGAPSTPVGARDPTVMDPRLGEALPTIAWATDADGRLEHVNSRWLEYSGRTAQLGSRIDTDASIHPEDRDAFRRAWRTALDGLEPLEETVRLRRHDGEHRWHLIRAVPVRLGDGAVRGWVGTSTDVEDTIRARTLTEEAERRYRDLVESVDAIIWEADPATLAFEFVSPRAATLLGHPAEAWTTGGGFWDAIVHSEDRAPVREAHLAAASANDGTTIDFRAVAADGRTVWLRDMVRVVADEAGRPVKLRGLLVDVSARKHARDVQSDLDAQRSRLEAILEQMPEGVIIADAPSGRLALGNRQVERIWRRPFVGAETVEDYVGYAGFHADGRPYAPDEWPLARAIAHAETVEAEEIEILRGDGTRGWIVASAAPVLNRDGRIVAGVVTFADVTERRRAEAERLFLADAASILTSTLDYEAAIVQVARLAVPRIGDWCIVELVDEEGVPREAAVAHADPGRTEAARALAERHPEAEGPLRAPAVARTGHAEVVPDLAARLPALAVDPEHLALLQALQLRSSISVPLVVEGNPIGALTFVGAESGRHYSEADLPFAELLAARIAAAVQVARLYRDADRYRRVLDASLDTVVLIDPQTLRFTYANRGAVDRLGYERSELLEMTPLDVTADIDEDEFRALIAPLVDGRREALTATLTERLRDGRITPVEVLMQYVEPAGAPGRIVIVARDIGERVEAQARLQRLAEAEHARAAELNAVLQAMGEGVVVCDAEGWITLANPAAEEIFANSTVRTYQDLLDRLEDPHGHAPRLGQRDPPVELRIKGPEERWVELSTYPTTGIPATDVARGSIETIVLLRDVTVARQRQAVRDTFVGVLSHELRTPVTTIYAGSKVLARESSSVDPEVRRSVFEDIQAEAERLHRLVEDVVALTRFGEEDADIGQEPVLLQRVIPGVVQSEEARWPGVTFEVAIPKGLPTVGADPTYLEQVVRNFLSNAAKYGGPGTTVRVSVARADDEVAVRIQDDGPGFPAGEADRLFELFFRSPSTAGAASGAGIGLFVCARLIRAMRGRVWARPADEGGAEFGFSLRVMADE